MKEEVIEWYSNHEDLADQRQPEIDTTEYRSAIEVGWRLFKEIKQGDKTIRYWKKIKLQD